MSVSSPSMCGGGETGMRIVVWFRRDLRVEDNPALAAAARAGGEVVPAYVWSPEEDGPYYPGRVSRWWISQSLQHLDASLRRLGAGKLVTRRSADAVVALLQLVRDTGATHVYFNHLYGLFLPVALPCGMSVSAQFRKIVRFILLLVDGRIQDSPSWYVHA